MKINNTKAGVVSFGVKTPIIKEGDDLSKIITESVLDAVEAYNAYEDTYFYDLNDKDIIGITESVVARANGLYLSLDDLVKEIKTKIPTGNVLLMNPIYSRNRFSLILKAFARACDKMTIIMPNFDEVGNPRGLNPNTGVDIEEFYKKICKENNCTCTIFNEQDTFIHEIIEQNENIKKKNGESLFKGLYVVDCSLRPENAPKSVFRYTLKDFGNNVNPNYGLLGSNKANEETLKLFPTVQCAMTTCINVQRLIKEKSGKHVEVMIYGDGCFKDATSGIWEFADPDVSPFYTEGLDGSPNEIKLKEFADNKFSKLSGEELNIAIKNEIKNKKNNLVGSMTSQGTTPRKYVNLLASLMDLTSGSGDKGTPVIVVKNYFNNYSN